MLKILVVWLFVLWGMPSLSFARDSVELRVTGRIIPAACVPAFSNGGVVRYDDFPANSGLPETTTVLGKKTMTLSVSCALATNLALKLVDNRIKLRPARQLVVANRAYHDNYRFGLGRAENDHGGYLMAFEPVGAGREAVAFLESAPGERSVRWQSMRDNAIRKNTLYTWAQQGGVASTGRRHFQAALSLQTVVNAASGHAATDDVDLDGSITFELQYL